MKDYYQILQISKTATDDEIKSAYRSLAKQYHPDLNPNNQDAEAKFKDVNEAYDVLKDPQKRSMYDQGAYNPQGGQGGFGGFSGFSGFSGGNAGGFGSFFEDIFEEMMGAGGGRNRQRQQRAGSDLLYSLNISLEEAYSGIEREIRINKLSTCDVCEGKGSNGEIEYENCKECGGRGSIRKRNGFFSVEQECRVCSGVGKIIKNPCKNCKGEGRINKSRTLMVKIPAGVDSGMKIRLSNEGEAGQRGAQNGDLYIMINVALHKIFKREGDNLYMSISLPMVIAALGDTVSIKTIDNKEIDVKIPEGIQSGKRIRIKSKGMQSVNNSKRGDLYLDVNVEIPVNLNKQQKEALSSFFAVGIDKKVKVISS